MFRSHFVRRFFPLATAAAVAFLLAGCTPHSDQVAENAKSKTDKDKTEVTPSKEGKTGAASEPAKDGNKTKKDGPTDPAKDGGIDVADLKENKKEKTSPPVLPDPPIKQPEPEKDGKGKDKDKKGDPVVPVVVQAPPIAPGVTAKDIDKAIERGVEYLKKTQRQDGSWGGERFALGYACLAGLALLECKVPAKDPMIQKIADVVRNAGGQLEDTYQASLAVLFLDKLIAEKAGDAGDAQRIQLLALRIASGQMNNGGWTYSFERLSTAEAGRHYGYLKTYYPWSTQAPRPKTAHEDKQDKKGGKGREIDLNNLPVDQLVWKAKLPREGFAPPPLGFGDNSNTQFALLALWTGRRYDVPAECPILLAYQRFRATQNGDGGWGYKLPNPNGGGDETGTTNTMTCAGLLGLALGSGAVPAGSNTGDKDKIQEPVSRGLATLGGFIGTPAPSLEAKLPMQNMYFLWSVERVGVLYDLKTIGGKDWYGWGAQILIKNQHDDGHWRGTDYPAASEHLDTCFALLFLKRANLVADLTENLRIRMPIRDPGAK